MGTSGINLYQNKLLKPTKQDNKLKISQSKKSVSFSGLPNTTISAYTPISSNKETIPTAFVLSQFSPSAIKTQNLSTRNIIQEPAPDSTSVGINDINKLLNRDNTLTATTQLFMQKMNDAGLNDDVNEIEKDNEELKTKIDDLMREVPLKTIVKDQQPLSNPIPPAIQMKVSGVNRFQKSAASNNNNELADSYWKDGKELQMKWGKSKSGETKIDLIHPEYGQIGRVPDEITSIIKSTIEGNDQDFKFEISNIVAGTTKDAETIGLRVNLIYTGNDKEKAKEVQKTFHKVLQDKNCADKTYIYQPSTISDKVLEKILNYDTELQAEESANEKKGTINNIVTRIKDPKTYLVSSYCFFALAFLKDRFLTPKVLIIFA